MNQTRNLVLFQVGSVKYLEEIKIGRPRFKADVSLRTVKSQKSAWAALAGSFICTRGEINREQKEALFHQWTWGSWHFTDISGGILNFKLSSCAILFGVEPQMALRWIWDTIWWCHFQYLNSVFNILNSYCDFNYTFNILGIFFLSSD